MINEAIVSEAIAAGSLDPLSSLRVNSGFGGNVAADGLGDVFVNSSFVSGPSDQIWCFRSKAGGSTAAGGGGCVGGEDR